MAIISDEKEAIQALSEVASSLDEDEFNELFEKMKELKETDYYFIINTGEKKYRVVTEHAYLELERLKKNELLRNSIDKTVKVKGLVSNIKMHGNSALFCLSPCEIDDVDIGHTWVRYSPAFKGIKYGSTVVFYSEITKYGDFNNKSGVNWQEFSYIRMYGGDNSPLYRIPLSVTGIGYAKRYLNNPETVITEDARSAYQDEIGINPSTIELNYVPQGRTSFSLKQFFFQDYEGIQITYNTFDRELVFNSKFSIIPDKNTQSQIDKLLLFEWLAKIEDWEFWGYARNRNN